MKEFDTKEFADTLGVSKRTVENWRSSRDGRLKPDHYDGQKAVYTEAQLADARALLAKSKPAPADAQDVTDTDAKIDSDAAQHADCDSGNSLDETADIEPVTATANVTADVQDTTDTDADIETIDGTEQAPVDSGNSPHDCEDEKSTLELTSPPPPITLDDRAERIRRLQVDVTHGIIEIGRELIAAKAQVPHGRWAEWLNKIQWNDRTARRFMAVAERFGKTDNVVRFQPATLQAMLALPAGTEQEFINEQADLGRPVETQSAREVKRNVAEFKAKRAPTPPHEDTSGTLFNVGKPVVQVVTDDTHEDTPAPAVTEPDNQDVAERFGNTNANSDLSVVNVVQPPEKSIDAAGNQSEISADEQDSEPDNNLSIGELIETVMKSNDVTNLRRLRNCIDARLEQLEMEDNHE